MIYCISCKINKETSFKIHDRRKKSSLIIDIDYMLSKDIINKAMITTTVLFLGNRFININKNLAKLYKDI